MPGTTSDLGYAVGVGAPRGRGVALSAACRATARRPRASRCRSPSRSPPSGSCSTRRSSHLDPLAIALIRLTLLAVVVRLGLTLWWLSRQRADLEALAASDPLTGLGNYRAFQEHLHSAVAAAAGAARRSASWCSTSITSRRSTTPSATPRATACCRPPPRRSRAPSARRGFVARVGGEEFAIAVADAGEEAAVQPAERCRAALAALPVPGPPLACSAGVASYRRTPTAPPNSCTPPTARSTGPSAPGRDRVRCFDPEHVVALSLHRAAARGRSAARDPRRDRPAIQPVMEVATGRVAGFEALARSPSPYARPPLLWFAQAHRCGLGPTLEARATRPRSPCRTGRPERSSRSTCHPRRCCRRR